MRKVKADQGYITKEEAARRLANFNEEDVRITKVISKYRKIVNNLIDKGHFQELPYKRGRIKQILISDFEQYLFELSKDEQAKIKFNKPPIPSTLAEIKAVLTLYEKDILTSTQAFSGIEQLIAEHNGDNNEEREN